VSVYHCDDPEHDGIAELRAELASESSWHGQVASIATDYGYGDGLLVDGEVRIERYEPLLEWLEKRLESHDAYAAMAHDARAELGAARGELGAARAALTLVVAERDALRLERDQLREQVIASRRDANDTD
jgi:hypothetical protein